jgi:hypothetical protein
VKLTFLWPTDVVTNGFVLTPMHKVDTHETREIPLIESNNVLHISLTFMWWEIRDRIWRQKSLQWLHFIIENTTFNMLKLKTYIQNWPLGIISGIVKVSTGPCLQFVSHTVLIRAPAVLTRNPAVFRLLWIDGCVTAFEVCCLWMLINVVGRTISKKIIIHILFINT